MGDQEKKGQIQIFAKNIRGKASGQIQEDSKITRNTVDGRHIQNGGNGVNNDVNTERKPLKIGHYFESAVWTNHKDEPIKRAVYGQSVRLHITMNKEYVKVGEEVQFKLYNVDKTTKKENHIGLVDTRDNKTTYDRVKIQNIKGEYKAIIIFTLTPDILDMELPPYMKNYLESLYCRCSYQSEHKDWEHKQMPKKQADYLEMGVLVIDRYKMPGLNEQGVDIAEDMAFGTGVPYKEKIYNDDVVSQFKVDYSVFGFDINRHAEFANIEPKVTVLEEVIVVGKSEKKNDLDFKIPPPIPADHTRVENLPKFPSLEEMEEAKRKLNEKNEKAIYTKERIENLGDMMKFSMKTDFRLWFNFRTLKAVLAWGQLSPVVDELIDKFKRNEGGVYENPILTENIKNADSTKRYCKHIENYIAEKLKTQFSSIEEVEDKQIDWDINEGNNEEIRRSKDKITGEVNKDGKNQTFSTPLFPYDRWSENNLFEGRTLSLNDIWATEVILKELTFSNNDDYVAKYEVTLYDHFGLDEPDLKKFFYYGNGFRAWFILQHIKGYKPFITKMSFTKDFKGSLNEGRSERINNEKQKQEEIRQKREKEDLEKANRMREIMRGPKI